MSDMERNKGKLIPVCYEDVVTIESDIDGLDDYEKSDYLSSISAVEINGKYYQVLWEVEQDSECYGFADVKENEDGSVDFHTYHYNGGGYWTEVVESALKNG